MSEPGRGITPDNPCPECGAQRWADHRPGCAVMVRELNEGTARVKASEPRTIRDGLVPLGPEDTYNGVKVSSFCMACRDAIARYEHGMQARVELCAEDSAKMQAGRSASGIDVTIGFRDPGKPAATNPLSLVMTHWVHRADQRVRVVLGLNERGGFIMSVSEQIDVVETVADLATLEADWERVKWMPGWFTSVDTRP